MDVNRVAWLTHLLIAVVAALGPVLAAAQAPARELLNSERIAAKFGSYGIEVLAQDAALRISNLYSDEHGARQCRTFAVVKYAPVIDVAIAAEHEAIVAGGSIGAVFAEHGWQVRKTHLYYGEIDASPRLAELMGIAALTPLATHVYSLDVVRDDRVVDYAALVEIHHPEYLQVADLVSIYGATHTERRDLVATLLALAHERSR
jgi:hypothetical protein